MLAAISNLDTWVATALEQLQSRRPLAVPPEKEMPEFKEPDNTGDAGDDNW